MNLNPYTDSGQINLCWAFYDLMERIKPKRLQINFTAAITWLEEIMDEQPVTEYEAAMDFIYTAKIMCYERN